MQLKNMHTAQSEIDAASLRRAFGAFATGITVITTVDHTGNLRGMTANSFTSVSLTPALLLVCVGKSAASYPAFAEADGFAVNILHKDQVDISQLFASKSQEKFSQVEHYAVNSSAPLLKDCLAWFDCRTFQRIDAGDHVVLIGEVRAFADSASQPLCFYRGRYAEVSSISPEPVEFMHRLMNSFIIENDEKILLVADGNGGWTLPVTGSSKEEINLESQAGLKLCADQTFIYSVFDTLDHSLQHMIYRSALADIPPRDSAHFKYFPIEQIPYDAISRKDIQAAIRRYSNERKQQKFGIYIGNSSVGRVELLERSAAP